MATNNNVNPFAKVQTVSRETEARWVLQVTEPVMEPVIGADDEGKPTIVLVPTERVTFRNVPGVWFINHAAAAVQAGKAAEKYGKPVRAVQLGFLSEPTADLLPDLS